MTPRTKAVGRLGVAGRGLAMRKQKEAVVRKRVSTIQVVSLQRAQQGWCHGDSLVHG